MSNLENQNKQNLSENIIDWLEDRAKDISIFFDDSVIDEISTQQEVGKYVEHNHTPIEIREFVPKATQIVVYKLGKNISQQLNFIKTSIYIPDQKRNLNYTIDKKGNFVKRVEFDKLGLEIIKEEQQDKIDNIINNIEDKTTQRLELKIIIKENYQEMIGQEISDEILNEYISLIHLATQQGFSIQGVGGKNNKATKFKMHNQFNRTHGRYIVVSHGLNFGNNITHKDYTKDLIDGHLAIQKKPTEFIEFLEPTGNPTLFLDIIANQAKIKGVTENDFMLKLYPHGKGEKKGESKKLIYLSDTIKD